MFTIDIDPVAFTIGAREVRWYGILVALAIGAVILWGYTHINPLGKQGKLPVPPDFNVIPAGIIGGMAGAKLVHIWERLPYYIQYPEQAFSGGGLAIYGGVLGATLGIWIYIRFTRRQQKNLHFGYYSDIIAPGIILGQAVGRIGCTINGCCYGTPTPDWLPWSVVYTHPNSYAPLNVPVHPTQIYEIIFALIGFGILLKLRKRLKPIEGALFFVYLIIYSAWRIGVGFLRSAEAYFFGLSQAQIISLVVLVISIFLLIRLTNKFKVTEQPST